MSEVWNLAAILANNPEIRVQSTTGDSQPINVSPASESLSGGHSGAVTVHISEESFQSTVIDYAHLKGWKVAHFRKAMTKDGNWLTPVQADGKGWLDLVVAHPIWNQFFIVELKSDTGKLSREQIAWIKLLRSCRVRVYVWRPRDWDVIVKTLGGANGINLD